jgi:hypothetical protein
MPTQQGPNKSNRAAAEAECPEQWAEYDERGYYCKSASHPPKPGWVISGCRFQRAASPNEPKVGDRTTRPESRLLTGAKSTYGTPRGRGLSYKARASLRIKRKPPTVCQNRNDLLVAHQFCDAVPRLLAPTP